MMLARDRDYIEARLLAPAPAALEAHERLQKLAHDNPLAGVLARRLMEATQVYVDACREIRKDVVAR